MRTRTGSGRRQSVPQPGSVALQSSRTHSVEEHTPSRRYAQTASGRFNSAATLQSRNTVGAADATRPRLAASIQPQPCSRGTPGGSGPTESPLPASFNSAATLQSRNPGPSDGKLYRRADVASIQPQPCSRGTPTEVQGDTFKPHLLQFSRNLAVAEHPAPGLRPLGEPIGFNSAATLQSRNTSANSTPDSLKYSEASIQPQPCSRGTLRRRRAPSRRPGDASIQPQPCSRGTRKYAAEVVVTAVEASIQPQPCSRGTRVLPRQCRK